MCLFLLKVFLDCSLYPNDASEEDEGHRRKNHQTVVYISEIINCLWDNLESEKSTASEKLTEECHDDKDEGITDTVSKTVHERCERLVTKSESLDTSHYDTVGDDKTDVY